MENNSQRRRTQQKQPVDFAYGHIQPQAPEVEKAVLGALMIDKDAYVEVCEILRAESFYEPRHQKIYAAIQQLTVDEKPVDLLTVTELLNKNGDLDEVGGPGYIADLSSRVATSANIEYHANIVAQKYLSRQIISYASVIGTKAYDETYDVNEVIQEAEKTLFEITQKNMRKDYSVFAPILGRAVKIVQDAHSNTEGVTGISTGFYKLDDITCGWQNSDLVIIAGRPAMGKTAFALSLAKNIAMDQRKPMAFFSLEMSDVQLANRMMSNVCSIDSKKLMNGQFLELRTKARRLKREHHIELIMIDYLQLMTASGMKFNSRQEEVSLISRSLKGLAKELNVPVLALSQLNRGVDSREGAEGKRPHLSDLRESGAIEQDADMVIFLHRPEYYGILMSSDGLIDYKGKAEVIISKHRKGATGIITMDFRGEYTRFENPEDKSLDSFSVTQGGEIRGSAINGENNPPGGFDNVDLKAVIPPPDNQPISF